jgi:hypothetical protein
MRVSARVSIVRQLRTVESAEPIDPRAGNEHTFALARFNFEIGLEVGRLKLPDRSDDAGRQAVASI